MKQSLRRLIESKIKEDLKKKIVVIAGPRQCGKTTLARQLETQMDYLSYDIHEDRSLILKKEWDRTKKLIVFDELHKMPKWKSWLKGIYDKEGASPSLLVTGSAKLDTFKKTGDSLAGRHFYYRLHPFDIKELVAANYHRNPDQILRTLFQVGGYPEPFLNESPTEYRRWRQTHLDLILRQDLLDFEVVKDIRSIELLVELLRTRVATGVSVNALALELQKDPKTILRWLNILEDLFVIFKLTPYAKDISRSLKKEPKYYFYDTGLVIGDEGTKLENTVACSLLKESHYQLDAHGKSYRLHYLKVKGGREIDFAFIPEDREALPIMIETKWTDADASPNFKLFESQIGPCKKIQLVGTLKRDFTTQAGVQVRKASDWLATLTL